MSETYYVRKCQECGHKQAMKPPEGQKTDAWRDAKCRACKSESLDYGSPGWLKALTGYVKPEEEEDV